MHVNFRAAIYLAAVCSGAAIAAAPVSDATASDLESRISGIERMLEARNQVQADMQIQLDSIQGEVNSLRGTLEVHGRRIDQILDRQRELYQEIDNKLAAKPAPAAKPAADKPAIAAPSSEKEAYESAVKLVLQDKQYEKAIVAFKGFITKYPNSAYGANAHYWLGQLLYNSGKREEAKAEFVTVAETYPDSNKRADALLKIGIIAEYQGQLKEAKGYYQKVVEGYPDSSSAQLAKPRLAALK